MWMLSIGLLAFAIVQSSGLPGNYGSPPRPYSAPKPSPPPPPVAAVAEPDVTNIYKTINKNNVLLPPYPTVESCTKKYVVQCTSSASITYTDSTGKAQTQSCNSYQTTNDFTNSIDYSVDLQVLNQLATTLFGPPYSDAPAPELHRVKRAPVGGRVLASKVQNQAIFPGNYTDLYATVVQFFSGQLGAARCQACCSAYATLNNGTDPTDGLGNAVSSWTPTTSWQQGQASSSTPDTTGTCGCCFTQQVETCIRVQDPDYNPDKFKKIPWKKFDSSSSSSGSHQSEHSKPKYSKSSSSSSSEEYPSYKKKAYDAGAE
jgi:hypothetical protein